MNSRSANLAVESATLTNQDAPALNTPSAGSQEYVGDDRNDDVLISVNGELVRRPEAKVSVFDSGFVLGDGVWEGLRLHGGRLAFLDRHFDRLWDGAKMLRIDIGLTRDELKARLFDVIEANAMKDGVHIRLMVTRGVKRSPYQDPRLTIGKATIVIIPEWKVPRPEMLAKGLDLFTVHIRRTGPAEQDQKLNSHSKLNCILACIQAMEAGADEGADARRPRLRRHLQLDAFLHRPQGRSLDLGRRLQPRRHHPRGGAARRAARRHPGLRERLLAVRRLWRGRGVLHRHVRGPDAGPQGRRPADRRIRARPASDASGPLTKQLRALYKALEAEEAQGRG